MKIFYSEYRNNYSTYTFSYAAYCLMEEQDELSDIYAAGFLPYSSDLTRDKDLFYLCRSIRVDLEKFGDTSENRRVEKKARHLGLTTLLMPKAAFDAGDPFFTHMALQYAAERYVTGSMSMARLEYIFKRAYVTHVLIVKAGEQAVGYVLLGSGGRSMHYYYSFFDTRYLADYSLGKWMMWKALHIAQESGMRHMYLGTCYGEKALYKVRDHKGIEFFDGARWNSDLSAIMQRVRQDEGDVPCDVFKSPGNSLLSSYPS
jgi:hypothetical protein